MTNHGGPDRPGGIPHSETENTVVRFRKARQAWSENTPEEPEDAGSIRQRYALRVPEPPGTRRSLFQRLLVTTLAILATYAALSQLIVYQLSANVLSDAFQRQLVAPAVFAMNDSLAGVLGHPDSGPVIADFLERRYAPFPRMTIAVYNTDGSLIAARIGTPGGPPSSLDASLLEQASASELVRMPKGLGFVAVSAVRGGPPPKSGRGSLLGFVRVAAQPSRTATLALIWQATWKWVLPVFLLSALTAYLGTRSITSRLTEAEEIVRRVAAGDTRARIPVGDMDELGRVALTFNRTVDLLERTVADLERTDSIRRRQVADFAHELNTPLTNVLAYLETLMMGEEEGGMDPTDRLGFLSVAHDEAKRLAHLARDLETLTKLEAGRLVMEQHIVDVSRIAVEMARRFIPRAEKHGLEVFTDIEPGGEIVGDRMRLEQVGMNLLENALRYTDKGAVTIFVRTTPEGVVLSVRDTGIGIPDDDIERVMSRFYRVDPSRTRSTGGSGLGLAIVGRIVQFHGGKVRIESEEDVGTTFHVDLPREGSTLHTAPPALQARDEQT